jgi:hypothetical protein
MRSRNPNWFHKYLIRFSSRFRGPTSVIGVFLARNVKISKTVEDKGYYAGTAGPCPLRTSTSLNPKTDSAIAAYRSV